MDKIHIKDAPSLNTECLIHALDRLTCLDHYFSQSREYLIKHILNKDQLHMPNSIPIYLSMGLCGQITSRLYESNINNSDVVEFSKYIDWRFFNNKTHPIDGQFLDFSKEVQKSFASIMATFGPMIVEHYEAHPEALLYYWHQVHCFDHFPLMQYDSESPYGAKRLKVLKEMVKTLTEIRSYAVKIKTESELKWPVLGSVIAPNELINKEKNHVRN